MVGRGRIVISRNSLRQQQTLKDDTPAVTHTAVLKKHRTGIVASVPDRTERLQFNAIDLCSDLRSTVMSYDILSE
jgi:hypothetical protein